MAQYTVTHTCGHDHVHQIYGSNSKGQRDNRRAWLATQECPNCAKARRAAEDAAKNAEAAATNAQAGLPELIGTPKQIAWAESIRAEKVREMEKQINHVAAVIEAGKVFKNGAEHVFSDNELAKGKEMIAAARACRNATNAGWWIENRSKVFDGMWMRSLVKG